MWNSQGVQGYFCQSSINIDLWSYIFSNRYSKKFGVWQTLEDDEFDQIQDLDQLRAVTTTIIMISNESSSSIQDVTLGGGPTLPSLQSTPKSSQVPKASNDSFVASSDLSETDTSLEVSGVGNIQLQRLVDIHLKLFLPCH